ncbi:MAG: radical SAM protein, partial [Exilispira sp.]
IDKIEENEKNRFLNPALDKSFHSRAFLKIQDGCNNNCTYCKVHIVRGEEVSLSYDKIIDSLYRITDAGFNEVVLTGINIAKYNYYNINFSTLLKNLIKIFPNLIFQLSSIEINNLDNEFFNIIKQPNIKPYFHLPLQSGSDFILSLMNRKYKVNEYIDIINKLKDNRPDSFLSTDIIVGFPQENEKTIMETLKVVLNVSFHHLHLFPFSKRYGTEAYKMKETLSPKEKSYYIERLNKIVKNNKNKYINSFIGKKDYFIIEKIEKTIDKYIILGRSYHNILIKSFLYDKFNYYKKGDYLPVYIYGKENDKLIAKIIEKK